MDYIEPYLTTKDKMVANFLDQIDNPDGNVAIIGSNYLLFGESEDDEGDCNSCVPYMGLQQPTDIYNAAFDVSLTLTSTLRKQGINAVSVIFPSDLPKGISREDLDKARKEYTYPKSFLDILETHGFGADSILDIQKPSRPGKAFKGVFKSEKVYDKKTLFVLESQYLRRATGFLRRIVKGKVKLPENCELFEWKDNNENTIFYIRNNNTNAVFNEIAIGLVNKEGLYTPYCQLIFGRFLEELSLSGITQIISVFDENETPCVDQAINCAYMFGLDMSSVTLLNVRWHKDGEMMIINNSTYGPQKYGR